MFFLLFSMTYSSTITLLLSNGFLWTAYQSSIVNLSTFFQLLVYYIYWIMFTEIQITFFNTRFIHSFYNIESRCTITAGDVCPNNVYAIKGITFDRRSGLAF